MQAGVSFFTLPPLDAQVGEEDDEESALKIPRTEAPQSARQ
jgi:hypothetical protein